MLRRIMPLMAVGLLLTAATARAQTPFPAPLPGQPAQSAPQASFPPPNGGGGFPAPGGGAGGFPPPGAGGFPSAGGQMGGGFGGPGPRGGPSQAEEEACMKQFVPLREDAENKAKALKAASERKAQPDEACKLLGAFDNAQLKMLKFVTANAARCGIPPQIAGQLEGGHKGTSKMKIMVCKVAEQRAKGGGGGPPAPSLSDALGSAASLPEANTSRKGGATFDTLNGNVLTR